MTISLTRLADFANQNLNKQPNIVLKIEGDPTCYGGVIIKKKLQYGDPVLYGDFGLFYGGSTEVENQADIISFSKGTTTNITQNVNIDTGIGNSIQSMQIALVDLGGVATDLISPGVVLDDILGARCAVYFGYETTNFPDDFITLFKGNVDEVNSVAGLVTLNIIHPDNFKRANLFTKAESDLFAAIPDNVSTTIIINDASKFFTPVTGPDGLIDQTIKYYGLIDGSEVFKYTGITGNQFTGVVRGQLGTIPIAHDVGESVESFVRLEGAVISDIALKLMLSGWDGPFVSDIEASSIVQSSSLVVPDSIFFEGIDVAVLYNLTVGDFVSVTGATNGSNDIVLSEVLEIVKLEDGTGTSYIIVNDSLVTELTTAAVVSFRSQYDTWGVGRGMQMLPEDVDIAEHIRISSTFLGGFNYDFYIKEGIDDSKEFLDKQVYNPAGCFSLVRKASASIGVQYPPLPTDVIQILNSENIKNAGSISLKRSTSRNFYNGVVYKFEDQPTEDKLLRIEAVLSGDSKSRFGQKIPDKFLVIESSGMREDLNARVLANSIAVRRLASYQFGAEYINGLKLNLQAGLTVEAGDVVLLDMSNLQVSDIETGSRSGDPRLWRINKKSFDVKTGAVSVDIIDTNFDKDVRYSLISPSSYIKFVNSNTVFIIEESFGGDTYGSNEYRKWTSYLGINVIIRNADYTVVSNPVQLLSNSANTFTLSADPGITLVPGLVMEFAPYDQLGVDPIEATVKLIYASFTDEENNFGDGGVPYRII